MENSEASKTEEHKSKRCKCTGAKSTRKSHRNIRKWNNGGEVIVGITCGVVVSHLKEGEDGLVGEG
ncbi:hypothetical protein J6590_058970 [Homalodisca vitripennis]|nr:hypothetical protein J6590_058970 [Homalodisca vitripennis]